MSRSAGIEFDFAVSEKSRYSLIVARGHVHGFAEIMSSALAAQFERFAAFGHECWEGYPRNKRNAAALLELVAVFTA